MTRCLRFTLLLICLSAPAFAQCTWVFNPFTRKLDCTSAGGTGNVSATLPTTANTVPLFSDTNGSLISSNISQSALGILSSTSAWFFDSQTIAENAGAPVLDLSVANFFILTMTQNDTMTLANATPISTQIPSFTLEVCDTAGGHVLTLPSGFSLASNPVRAAGECTVQSFWFNSGNAVPIGPAFTTIAPTVLNGLERARQGTPAAGSQNCNLDSTGHNFECVDSAAAVSGTAFTNAGGGGLALGSFDATTGLFTTVSTGGGVTHAISQLDYQGAAGAITGTGAAATVFTTTVPSIPAGGCVNIDFGLSHTTGTASVVYSFSYSTFNGTWFTSTHTGVKAGIVSLCNNAGVQNAQQWNFTSGSDNNGGTFVGVLPAVVTGGAIASGSSQTLKLTFNVAATDAVTPEWWRVWVSN